MGDRDFSVRCEGVWERVRKAVFDYLLCRPLILGLRARPASLKGGLKIQHGTQMTMEMRRIEFRSRWKDCTHASALRVNRFALLLIRPHAASTFKLACVEEEERQIDGVEGDLSSFWLQATAFAAESTSFAAESTLFAAWLKVN